MTLPASFLQSVEQHACFTGCYNGDSLMQVCLDPVMPLVPMVVVSCQDCLGRIGVPASLLPPGTTGYNLASQLTQHMRGLRGYTLSKSGYHTNGPGFWLSLVYFPCGLFLLDGERSRHLGSDQDLLMLAFKHSVVQAPDPRMTDPKLYTLQTVYLHFGKPPGAVPSKQNLLASGCCRTTSAPGWHKATLAEFLPLTSAPATTVNGGTKPATSLKAPPKPLKVGDICPICGAEVRQRALLNSSFVGCLC